MVTVALRQAGLPLPAAMVMMSPAFSLAPLPNTTAYEREPRDPMIRQAWAQDVERALRVPHDHPLADPMQQDLRGLPPALVQVGEDEVLFDNAPWYNDAATRAGSHSELEIYLKRWHVFQAHAGLDAQRGRGAGAAGGVPAEVAGSAERALTSRANQAAGLMSKAARWLAKCMACASSYSALLSRP